MRVKVTLEGIIPDYDGYPHDLDTVKATLARGLPGGYKVTHLERIPDSDRSRASLQALYEWIPTVFLTQNLSKKDARRFYALLAQIGSELGLEPRDLEDQADMNQKAVSALAPPPPPPPEQLRPAMGTSGTER